MMGMRALARQMLAPTANLRRSVRVLCACPVLFGLTFFACNEDANRVPGDLGPFDARNQEFSENAIDLYARYLDWWELYYTVSEICLYGPSSFQRPEPWHNANTEACIRQVARVDPNPSRLLAMDGCMRTAGLEEQLNQDFEDGCARGDAAVRPLQVTMTDCMRSEETGFNRFRQAVGSCMQRTSSQPE